MNGECKRAGYVALVLAGVMSMLYLNTQLQSEELTRYTVTGCDFHRLDPFDPRVMSFIPKHKPPKCGELQKNLMKVTMDGHVTFTHSIFNNENVTCYYQKVIRQNSDFKMKFSDRSRLQNGSVLTSDVAVVTCDKGKTRIYENVFALVHQRRGVQKSSNDTPNVFLFGMDSLSSQNSLRQLKRVNQFLKNTLHGHVMRTHIKVGENTRPNMIALTTGKSTFKVKVGGKARAELTHCSTPACKDDFIDDWPFIWKEFAKMGYTTVFGEDKINIEGAFYYDMKGFRHIPTHHYLRSFFLAWDHLQKHGKIAKKKNIRCLMDKPVYLAMTEWITAIMRTYSGTPLFMITFSGITHDHLGEFQIMDKPYAHMLKKLAKEDLLNNTIVIGFGDHGYRFGKFRDTWMGRIEDNMPFLSISLPSWMRKEYPHLEEILKYNEDSITTNFDVHATLQDVLYKRFAINGSTFHEQVGRGVSLFKKIFRNRTCADAGINDIYCPCFKEQLLLSIDESIKKAVTDVVDTVNGLLKNTRGVCAKLHSPEIKRAFEITIKGDPFSNRKNVKAGVRLEIQMQPSNGVFEAGLTYEYKKKKYLVSGTILRKDRYGDQGRCVKDNFLEKYCFCLSNKTATIS